jgi:hypothetical protein
LLLIKKRFKHIFTLKKKKRWHQELHNIFKTVEKKQFFNVEKKSDFLKILYKSTNRLLKNHMHEIAIQAIHDYISIFVTEKDGYAQHYGLFKKEIEKDHSITDKF